MNRKNQTSDSTKYIVIDPCDRGYEIVTGEDELQEHLNYKGGDGFTVYEVAREFKAQRPISETFELELIK